MTTTTTRLAHLSTEENRIQETIADWDDSKSRAFFAEFEAYALETLGAEALAEIKSKSRAMAKLTRELRRSAR